MDKQKIIELAEGIVDLVNAPDNTIQFVNQGDDLQVALNKGGLIYTADNAVFKGNYKISVSGTQLIGPLTNFFGSDVTPTIAVVPRTNNVTMILGDVTNPSVQNCILIGENTDNQTKVDDAPDYITLICRVPTFRGKHAIGIHGRHILIKNTKVYDVYSPTGQDAQAIGILNSPGPISIDGCDLSAASEIILIGGDPTKIPNMTTTGVTIQHSRLFRPLSWRTDGIKRVVKNIFESKGTENLLVFDVDMDGAWKDGQDGFGIVLTQRFGCKMKNIEFNDVRIKNVAWGIRTFGYDDKPGMQLEQATDLRFIKVQIDIDDSLGEGARAFLESTSEVNGLTIDTCRFTGKGTTIYTGKGMGPNGGLLATTKGFKLVNSMMDMQSYGIHTLYGANSANWKQAFPDGIIENNQFTHVKNMDNKKNLPTSNTFSL